jgi:hypothetical protein
VAESVSKVWGVGLELCGAGFEKTGVYWIGQI